MNEKAYLHSIGRDHPELLDKVNVDSFFYYIMKKIQFPKFTKFDIVYMQIVEDKLIDEGMEYNEIISNDEFITIIITRTDNFKIYSYMRKLNKLFKIKLRRNSYQVNRWNYYVHLRKEKLLL